MKKQKSQKKSKELTVDELRKLLADAGFVIVHKHIKPRKILNEGPTTIFPEGSKQGIPIK